METLKNSLTLTDDQRRHLQSVEAKCRKFYTDPENAEPNFYVTALPAEPPVKDWINDPLGMLKMHLNRVKSHLEIGDDYLPTIRAEFGTALVPFAFGCEPYYTDMNLPAAGSHVLKDIQDARNLPRPGPESGLYRQVAETIRVFQEEKPDFVKIQLPDMQSPFNCSHLIRGDGIFMDFYDDPESVEVLLDKVTDYMISQIKYFNRLLKTDPEWFYDWGVLWKGQSRISNCSMQMISPDFYRNHVMARDARLFKSIGGGRMHYCGQVQAVIKDFFTIPDLHGFDGDPEFHDLWEIAPWAPKNLPISLKYSRNTPAGERLLAGDWPAKRNLIIGFGAKTVAEGRETLKLMRESWARYREKTGK
jgi:hypothetical protein